MKKYVFIYKDKKGNELQRKEAEFFNIKEARAYANDLLANSLINDLHKISVVKK